MPENKDMCVHCGEGVINIRVGAIIIKDNKVLMVKNDRDNYYYSVGGRIQFGETAEQAVKREVKEELGFEMEVDRLGFICEAYFYGTIGDKAERLIYEPAFYFYMKTPDDFSIQNSTFLEDGTPEYLEWILLNTDKIIYPEFFKTELMSVSEEIKHIVADERIMK
ncbi:MAG: NUDIX domain-containing protein [Saccharofermentanales bacterium]